MVNESNMDIKTLRRDFKNKGGYKTKITDNKTTVIDSNSVTKMESHINKITDTLFLGLSRGMRFPAMYTGEIYYDSTADSWGINNNLNYGSNFLKSVQVNKTGSQIETLIVTFDSNTIPMSDSTPLFFVYNNSTLNDYENDFVVFPRLSEIDQSTITITLETNDAGSWSYYESDNNGEEGLSIGIDCLLQSTVEAFDYNFYTLGVPDWTYLDYNIGQNTVQVIGYVDNTIVETSDVIDWECKVNGKCIEWEGDCTTGSPVSEAQYVYSLDYNYKIGEHTVQFTDLLSAVDYKVWIQIDSKVGPDSLEWQPVGCYLTESPGGGKIPNPQG